MKFSAGFSVMEEIGDLSGKASSRSSSAVQRKIHETAL